MTVPARYRSAKLEDFDAEVRGAVERFTLEDDGFLILGSLGAGKTWLAAGIVNSLQCRTMFATAAQWVNDFRAEIAGREPPHFGQETTGGACSYAVYVAEEPGRTVLQRGIEADLVVIDDLGAIKSTEYAEEQFYALVDGRTSEMRTMIVTTNLDLDALRQQNPRVFDRLRYLETITLVGKSKRRPGQKRAPDVRLKAVRTPDWQQQIEEARRAADPRKNTEAVRKIRERLWKQ